MRNRLSRTLRRWTNPKPPQRRIRRNALRDLLVLGGLAFFVFLLARMTDVAERFFEFSRAHEAWELDEIFFVLGPTLIFFLLIFAVLRWLDTRHLLRLAYTDELTGLLNRHGVSQVLYSEMERGRRYDHPLSVMLLDVDYFKRINDTYGHAAGDDVLRAVAELLQTTVRNSDIVARWGGEEFLVIAPETTLAEARKLAERLRERIAAYPFAMAWAITVSIGIAAYQVDEPANVLIHRADSKLYEAKEAGRNRIV